VPLGYHRSAATSVHNTVGVKEQAVSPRLSALSGRGAFGMSRPGEAAGATLEAEAERAPGATCLRGLSSNTNKSDSGSATDNRQTRRVLVHLRRLLNHETGEVVDVDPRVCRVQHMARRVRAWSRTCDMLNVRGRLCMLTLTYADGSSWRADDIARYMETLSKALGEALRAYCWVAELQERGAIHYHVLVVVDRGTDIPAPDTSGMWTHGTTRRETAYSPWYIVKYAQKGIAEGEEYPGGARICGASWRHLRQIAVECGQSALLAARYVVKLSTTPGWLVARVSSDIQAVLAARRHVGGGWCVGETVYKSPWTVQWIGGWSS